MFFCCKIVRERVYIYISIQSFNLNLWSRTISDLSLSFTCMAITDTRYVAASLLFFYQWELNEINTPHSSPVTLIGIWEWKNGNGKNKIFEKMKTKLLIYNISDIHFISFFSVNHILLYIYIYTFKLAGDSTMLFGSLLFWSTKACFGVQKNGDRSSHC